MPLHDTGRASLLASRVPMPARAEPRPPGITLDFFVFSYFRVFVIDLEELPWAMTSSRFPRGSSRRPSPCNGPPRRLAPQLQRLDACRETNCGGMRSNRSRKHESTKARKWPRWRRSLARGGFLSSSIEIPSLGCAINRCKPFVVEGSATSEFSARRFGSVDQRDFVRLDVVQHVVTGNQVPVVV